jgi:hypothetical protein
MPSAHTLFIVIICILCLLVLVFIGIASALDVW